MHPALLDSMTTFLLCGGLATLGIVGVVILPWRQEELDATSRGLEAAWALASRGRESAQAATQATPAATPGAYRPRHAA